MSDNDIEADTNLAWSWSPNSQWFAFTARQFGRRDIFIVNIYNIAPIQLPTADGENFSPQWQPAP